MSDYSSKSFLKRDILNSIGKDQQSVFGGIIPKDIRNEAAFDLMPDHNFFFTKTLLHRNYYIGKQFGCSHQLYNHIPRKRSLASVDRLTQLYQEYREKYGNECVSEFIPQAYFMQDKVQCEELFNYIKSKEFTDLKRKHKAALVSRKDDGASLLLNETAEIVLKARYEDGAKCGIIKGRTHIQKYLTNQLLVADKKFTVSAFGLIASTNPLIVYYHDGFVTLNLDPRTLRQLTDKKARAELLNAMVWNFTKLERYVEDKKLITKGSNWLEESLRPELQRIMTHIVKMSRFAFLNYSNVYELLEFGFVIDDQLKPWFVKIKSELNSDSPSSSLRAYVTNMYKDHFEIMQGYLRSRMKRVMKLMNQIIAEIPIDSDFIPKKAEYEKTFERINKNYFDPEFAVSASRNGFTKILDENLEKEKMYAGLISSKCFAD
jgi:hypothetical protein